MEKILIVDDIEINLMILEELLQEKYKIETAKNGVIALEKVKKDPPALILLDIMMPEMDGFTFCKIMKSKQYTRNIPIIFITALDKQEDIVKGFECGGQDYVSKPIKVLEVMERVKMHLDLVRTREMLREYILELEKKNSQLENMVRIDFLTNLASRRYMFDCLKKEVSRCKRNNEKFSILMADIDYFKLINDNYGHETGDSVLRDMAKVMQKTLREHDIVSRWGGEEFLMLLPYTDERTAEFVAEKIRRNIENVSFDIPGDQIKITHTIGITEFDMTLSIEKNTSNADKALYYGKLNDRNMVVVYKEGM